MVIFDIKLSKIRLIDSLAWSNPRVNHATHLGSRRAKMQPCLKILQKSSKSCIFFESLFNI